LKETVMRENELDSYILELARARATYAKASPMADNATIARAAERVAVANRALRAASRQLDHLLGHPWRVGADPCECSKEDIAAAYAEEKQPTAGQGS
jgi:hypothetical protein